MVRMQILYVGDRDSVEFAEPVRWLAERVELSFAADADAGRLLARSRGAPFDLIVVAQSRPGELSNAGFEGLRAAAPLAPIVSLLGSYCEGDARTGKPWPGAVRVYAHQFVVRMGAQLERLKHTGAMNWALPFTATEEERLLCSSWSAADGSSARVAVVSNHAQTAVALCDALQFAGLAAVWGTDGVNVLDGVDVVVYDCPAGFAASQLDFERLVRHMPRTPKIVVLGFPRAEDEAAALTSGAAGVVSKPFLVEDLLWRLRDCLDTRKNGV